MQPNIVSPKKHRGLAIGIVAIVVAIGLAVGIFVAFTHNAVLTVNLTSDHILNSVSYSVMVNSDEWDSGTLGPLQTIHITGTVSWFGDHCEVVVIRAFSAGGGLGPQSDVANGQICGGETATASLIV